MRRVFRQGGAIFALLAILIAPAVYADDPPPGTEPPQMRIGPPGGVASDERSAVTEPPQARIGPPTGEASGEPPPQNRIGPPIGVSAPELLELFWLWLQMRIGPPTG